MQLGFTHNPHHSAITCTFQALVSCTVAGCNGARTSHQGFTGFTSPSGSGDLVQLPLASTYKHADGVIAFHNLPQEVEARLISLVAQLSSTYDGQDGQRKNDENITCNLNLIECGHCLKHAECGSGQFSEWSLFFLFTVKNGRCKALEVSKVRIFQHCCQGTWPSLVQALGT